MPSMFATIYMQWNLFCPDTQGPDIVQNTKMNVTLEISDYSNISIEHTLVNKIL